MKGNAQRVRLLQLGVFLFAVSPSVASAATVSYTGKLFSEFGAPIQNGYVVVGTFAPGFDPFDYNCVYGDEDCNQIGGAFGGAYDSAVAEGNFNPIGAGTLTGSNGDFLGFGESTADAGTDIWLFGFEDDSRSSFFQVLASSSDAAWKVPEQPAGVTSIDARQASIFVMGTSHLEGVSLSVIPFPEPTSLALAMLAVVGLASQRVQRTPSPS